MVKMLMIRVNTRVSEPSVRTLYMRAATQRAYVFVDSVNDERATMLHGAITGELRTLGFPTRHLGPVHS